MVDLASPNCNHMTTRVWALDIYVRSQFVHEQKQKKLQQKAKILQKTKQKRFVSGLRWNI